MQKDNRKWNLIARLDHGSSSASARESKVHQAGRDTPAYAAGFCVEIPAKGSSAVVQLKPRIIMGSRTVTAQSQSLSKNTDLYSVVSEKSRSLTHQPNTNLDRDVKFVETNQRNWGCKTGCLICSELGVLKSCTLGGGYSLEAKPAWSHPTPGCVDLQTMFITRF